MENVLNVCESEEMGGSRCEDKFTCCDCGGTGCGCAGCWSCNACALCLELDEE